MDETWKVVEGTDGLILVSDKGRIMSKMRNPEGNIIKPTKDQKGYLRIKITIKRQSKSYKVHRMVAQAFIPNPDNKPQVNHIDGCKTNNRVSNLEWVTNKENAHHAIEYGLWKLNQFSGTNKQNKKSSTQVNTNKIKSDNKHKKSKTYNPYYGKGTPQVEGFINYNNQRKKPIIAIKGDEMLIFESVSEAERYCGTKHINAVIKGERTHAKGWKFAYESEVV